MIFFILLIFITVIIGCKYTKYSDLYKEAKDLQNIKLNLYTEEIQNLEKVYVKVNEGRVRTKVLCIQTSELYFIAGNDIVTEDKYNEFVEKYKNVKKVKIKYLPNSFILLSIEPADEN